MSVHQGNTEFCKACEENTTPRRVRDDVAEKACRHCGGALWSETDIGLPPDGVREYHCPLDCVRFLRLRLSSRGTAIRDLTTWRA